MGLKPRVTMNLGEMLIDLTVSTTISSVVILDGPGNRWKQSLNALSIDGPGTLTGTATVQVSDSLEDTDEYGTTWRDLQSAGADVTIPADGYVRINANDAKRIRIRSGSAEAANRRFRLKGIEDAS
jgi:hypothetical protein